MSNGSFIAFLRMSASGIERVTVAVIKASAVPRDTPLSTRTSIMGISQTEFAYKGSLANVATGTVHHCLLDK